jgi:hypothetical protein
MSKYIIKDNYNIEYNITDSGLTISIYNEDNSNKYSVTETREKYNSYFTIGMNIFNIIDKSFINDLFVITDNIDNIIIAFNTIKETIRCDIVKDDNKQMVSADSATIATMAKKINELELQIKRLEKLDKFVFIGQHRINRHKKHLIVQRAMSPNINPYSICTFSYETLYKIHKIFKDYNGNSSNINYFLPEKEQDKNCTHMIKDAFHFTNDDYDTPIVIKTEFIDIEDILQLDLDILTLHTTHIKNGHLLKYFRGRHLHICYPIMNTQEFYDNDKKHNLDGLNQYNQMYHQRTKLFYKQLRDTISQLSNLVSLTFIAETYQSKGRNSKLKFKYNFFKNMKSLKSLMVYDRTVVKYDTSREIDVYS